MPTAPTFDEPLFALGFVFALFVSFAMGFHKGGQR